MEKTPYNHGGYYKHAGPNADACIKVLKDKLQKLETARTIMNPMNMGDANRLNDYARDLLGTARNLVHFLEHAGAWTKEEIAKYHGENA